MKCRRDLSKFQGLSKIGAGGRPAPGADFDHHRRERTETPRWKNKSEPSIGSSAQSAELGCVFFYCQVVPCYGRFWIPAREQGQGQDSTGRRADRENRTRVSRRRELNRNQACARERPDRLSQITDCFAPAFGR